MSAADVTGSRPAQSREPSRCPDCGSIDPCVHDERADAAFVAVFVFAVIGVLCTLVAAIAGALALVRWMR